MNDQFEREERGTCTTCSGVGYVIVPMVAGMETLGGFKDGMPFRVVVREDGKWRTCAVTCRCGLGRHIAKNAKEDKRMPTLEEYERHTPDWKQIVKDHDAEIIKHFREERVKEKATRPEPEKEPLPATIPFERAAEEVAAKIPAPEVEPCPF